MIGFGVLGGGDDDNNSANADGSTIPAVGSAAGSAPTGAVTAAPGTTPAPTTEPIEKTPISQSYSLDMYGDDVEMIQQRLFDLGFDPGPVDGHYGSYTRQAVWAFEKLVMDTPREEVTGTVTPDMWDRMQEPVTVEPRRSHPDGGHVEIYLPEQIAIIFQNDEPELIAHSSSGDLDENGDPIFYEEEATWTVDAYGQEYEEPKTGIASAYAKTPAGVFEVHRKETGNHQSSLGGMTNPVYFNYGIALHGANNVPAEPASHGCIRINQYLGGYFQDLIDMGDTVYVWGFDGRQPEEYSEDESLPSFDARTYATTVPPTTVPETTVPPTAAPTTEPSETVTATTTPATEPPATEPPATTGAATTTNPSSTEAPSTTAASTAAPTTSVASSTSSPDGDDDTVADDIIAGDD